MPVYEQPAQQQLGEDDRGHELHGLELGARESADEQAERHAEHGIADGEQPDQPCAVGGVQAEQHEPDEAHHERLQRGEQPERDAVAGEQVGLGERQAHQPLQRAAGALAQHRNRRDQEHDAEREQAAHRRPDRLEGAGLPVEDVAQQNEQPNGTTSSSATVRGSRRICHSTRRAVASVIWGLTWTPAR